MSRIDKAAKLVTLHSFSKEKMPAAVKRRRVEKISDVDLIKQSSIIRVSKNDPMASKKLELKLASLLALEENMLRTNEFLKNQDRAGLLQYGYSAEGVEELFLCGARQQIGFSVQEIENMAGEIVDVRSRLAAQATKVTATASDVAFVASGAYRYPQTPLTSIRQLLGIRGAAWRLESTHRPLLEGGAVQVNDQKPVKITYH